MRENQTFSNLTVNFLEIIALKKALQRSASLFYTEIQKSDVDRRELSSLKSENDGEPNNFEFDNEFSWNNRVQKLFNPPEIR